ncbi:hypothetical protein [Saccharopolyspora sp. NPDC002376]
MGTIKVTAPNSTYTGISAGVAFANGEAQVDADNIAALQYFRGAGYTVEDSAKAGKAPSKAPSKPAGDKSE